MPCDEPGGRGVLADEVDDLFAIEWPGMAMEVGVLVERRKTPLRFRFGEGWYRMRSR
ncbi:MAG: hypothetical protein ACREOH_05735 [Candidatus Entotheonellia bacterium]